MPAIQIVPLAAIASARSCARPSGKALARTGVGVSASVLNGITARTDPVECGTSHDGTIISNSGVAAAHAIAAARIQ